MNTKQLTLTVMIIAAVLLVMVFGTVRLYHRIDNTKTVYVNVKAAVSIPVSLAAKKFSREKQARFVKAYTAAVGTTIRDYGKAHHVTIIAGTILYAQAGRDITDTIIAQTLARLGDKV